MYTLLTQGLVGKSSASLITDGLRARPFDVFKVKLCLKVFTTYSPPAIAVFLLADPEFSLVAGARPGATVAMDELPVFLISVENDPALSLVVSDLPKVSVSLSTC